MGSLGRRSQTTARKGHRRASLTGFVRDVSVANCSNKTGMGKHGGVNTKGFHHRGAAQRQNITKVALPQSDGSVVGGSAGCANIPRRLSRSLACVCCVCLHKTDTLIRKWGGGGGFLTDGLLVCRLLEMSENTVFVSSIWTAGEGDSYYY